MAITSQTNIKKYAHSNITNYSLFLGGINATKNALEQYDPLRGNYSRIFFIQMPEFMKKIMPTETINFRHMLEYGFTTISGIQNISLDFEQITGGYAGRSMDVPTVAKDETQSITVSVYEFAGSPIREYLDMWISGISDPYTGIATYHGATDIDSTITYSQSNHVAEAIYVTTDPTGRSNGIEYCSLLSNMMPKQVKQDHLNYESGSHPITTMDIEFSCVQYRSPQINSLAKALIDKYTVMRDYLEFSSGYDVAKVTTTDVPNFPNWNRT